MFKNNRQKNKGFTILFAVIVSSLVLAVGISIANITLKQILISASGRDSQVAFYTADSGSECAIYYDLIEKTFPTSTESSPSIDNIDCMETSGAPIVVVDGGISNATSTFTVGQGVACAKVTIGKHDRNGDGYVDRTIIQSRGYNICDENNPRRLERGLEIIY
jgi:Tfp pilus assembly protein PilX